MLRIRLKEIENSKKQIETNTNTITKMKRQLNSLGGSDGKGEANWETKYQEQVDLKKQLELQIKQLEKQNSNQGLMLHRAENEDSGEAKLKALQEDLRVWKAKVSQLAVQLERETKTRSEQEQKITKLQAENK